MIYVLLNDTFFYLNAYNIVPQQVLTIWIINCASKCGFLYATNCSITNFNGCVTYAINFSFSLIWIIFVISHPVLMLYQNNKWIILFTLTN